MGTPIVSAQEMARRKREAVNLLRGTKIPRTEIEQIMEQKVATLDKLRARFALLKGVNAPVLKHVLIADEKKFQNYLARYKTGMTSGGERVFDYLLNHGISESVAKQFAQAKKGKQFSLEGMKKRIEYLENYPLESKRYGVERIPVSVIEKLLKIKPFKLVKGIKNALREVEDAYSAKRLDALLPGWRNKRSFVFRLGSGPSPTTLLKKILAARANGTKITTKVISGSSIQKIKMGVAGSRYISGKRRVNGVLVLVPKTLGKNSAQIKLEAYRKRLTELENKYVGREGFDLARYQEYIIPLVIGARTLRMFVEGVLPAEREKALVAILKSRTKIPRPEIK